MGGRTVEIIIIFLDVLPVIGLAIGQAKSTLLEDRILTVPQRQRKTQPLVIITKTREAVLAPMIGARTGLIVTKIVPGVSVLAVVFANGAPLSLAEVGSPLPPWHSFLPRFIQPLRFGRIARFCGLRLGHDFLPRA